ncbi:hypothetical protein DSUL_50443 [Desulfovibrionales bacterium]
MILNRCKKMEVKDLYSQDVCYPKPVFIAQHKPVIGDHLTSPRIFGQDHC